MAKRTYGIWLTKSPHHFWKPLPIHSVSASEARTDREHLRSVLRGGEGLCGGVWGLHGFSAVPFWASGCDGLLHCRSVFVNVSLVYLYCLLAKGAIIWISYAMNIEDHFLCDTETSTYSCRNLLERGRQTLWDTQRLPLLCSNFADHESGWIWSRHTWPVL